MAQPDPNSGWTGLAHRVGPILPLLVVLLQVLCHYKFMIEMGPLMSENQVKKSLSCVVSPHLTRLGEKTLHTP